jgi:hypothetical protein
LSPSVWNFHLLPVWKYKRKTNRNKGLSTLIFADEQVMSNSEKELHISAHKLHKLIYRHAHNLCSSFNVKDPVMTKRYLFVSSSFSFFCSMSLEHLQIVID